MQRRTKFVSHARYPRWTSYIARRETGTGRRARQASIMSSDSPPSHFLDAAKASAVKLKEKQAALEARARELAALQAQLVAERTELEGRAAKVAGDREALDHEKAALEDVRASIERDLAAIKEGREKLTLDEERFVAESKALEHREAAIHEDEARVDRLAQALKGQMLESESHLRDLMERGDGITKLQADWLAAFEARAKELRAIGEDMHARQADLARQGEALAGLKDALRDELSHMFEEREALGAKERSISEAEKYLAMAFDIEAFGHREEEAPASPPPTEEAAMPGGIPVVEEIPEEPETNRPATKGEAMERLTQAIEAWKRARDAGRRVSDIRKVVKWARAAIDSGDYDAAFRSATEILDQLQAAPVAR